MADWYERAKAAYLDRTIREREAEQALQAAMGKKLAIAVEKILGCEIQAAWPAVSVEYGSSIAEFSFMDGTCTTVGIKYYCKACVDNPLFPINELEDIGALIVNGTPPHGKCPGAPILM